MAAGGPRPSGNISATDDHYVAGWGGGRGDTVDAGGGAVVGTGARGAVDIGGVNTGHVASYSFGGVARNAAAGVEGGGVVENGSQYSASHNNGTASGRTASSFLRRSNGTGGIV